MLFLLFSEINRTASVLDGAIHNSPVPGTFV